MALATAGHVLYHQRGQRSLVRGAVLLLALVTVQITLGALTVLSGRQPVINSLHVVTGASVLATTLVLTLRAHRPRFTSEARVASARDAAGLRGAGRGSDRRVSAGELAARKSGARA
jgi:cytochrome c oxidase assembly protein subunit 15